MDEWQTVDWDVAKLCAGGVVITIVLGFWALVHWL